MDTERTANKEYCFIRTKLNREYLRKSILNSIYIVLQTFYTLSGCADTIKDRFVNYEKNQFSSPNVPLAYSSHRTALF